MRGMYALLPAIVTLVLAACRPPAAQVAGSPLAGLEMPALDSSTSAHPLLRLVACELVEVACGWSAGESENVERTIVPESGANPDLAASILALEPGGTNGAYTALIEGRADLILVARAPSEDELAAAEEAGVPLDVKPIALDAFVFVVNVANPVESLSIDTLRAIYAGRITTWDELGIAIEPAAGLPLPIVAYQREQNSGSQELMEDLVMRGTPMVEAPDLITTSMLGPYNAIGGNRFTGGGDTRGLGYSIYYYATAMFPHEYVRMVAVDGVTPGPQTIADRSYPLTTEVYVVIRAEAPASGSAARLRDWLLSAEGQAVVARSGYIPLAPEAAGP